MEPVHDFEQWVRLRAYAIWEEEGHPDGQHERHWAQATYEAKVRLAAGIPFDHEPAGPPVEDGFVTDHHQRQAVPDSPVPTFLSEQQATPVRRTRSRSLF